MSQPLVPVGRRLVLAWLVVSTAMLLWAVGLHAGSEPSCPTGDTFADEPHSSPASAVATARPMTEDAASRSPGPWVCDEPTASGMAGPSASFAVSSPEATTTIEVAAWDVYFDPSDIHLPATGASRIVLTNHGYAAHNLTIDELGIQVVAARGRSDEATVADVPPGTYAFYCSVSGHRLAGMEGVLIVE